LISGSDGLEELYHVAGDPDELVDCSAEEPVRTRELRDRLDEWLGSFTHGDTDNAPEMDAATKDRLADLGYM